MEYCYEHVEQAANLIGFYANNIYKLSSLQRKSVETIDGYARAVRRIAGYFDRCPTISQQKSFKSCYSSMSKATPGAASRLIYGAWSFFYRYVLGWTTEWIKIVKPPQFKSAAGYSTPQEVQRLINSVTAPPLPRVLPDGLQPGACALVEGLDLEVGDMDDPNFRRVHIRQAKGGRIATLPLAGLTLPEPTTVLDDPPEPALAVPNPSPAAPPPFEPQATDGSQCVQAALRQRENRVLEFHKHLTVHSLRHA